MSVLVVGHYFDASSQLWMRRMLEMLGPADAEVVSAAGRVPAVIAQRYVCHKLELAVWERAAQRVRLARREDERRRQEKALARVLKRRAPKAVLVHFLTVAVRFRRVWEQSPVPVFVHCHGYDVTWDLRAATDAARRAHPADYEADVRALPAHVGFIANSHATKARLLDVGIEPTRIEVKHLGVPVPADPPTREGRDGPCRILYLGRLVDFKGPERVIEAFERAMDQGLDGELIMAGDGPLRAMCELMRARSRYRQRIEMLGAVDGATGERLRREADLFTAHNCVGPVTGQEEAFGVSVVEAMGAARPVVSGRSGSLPEVLGDDGEAGVLVEPDDVAGHASALVRLAESPELRARMGSAGWARAREHFSLEREQRRLREILGLSEREMDSQAMERSAELAPVR